MKGFKIFGFTALLACTSAYPSYNQYDQCPPNGGEGYFAHPTDCTKFIQCGFGGPFVMPCAPGTHWNDALKTCDHPENANCMSGGSSGCCGCGSDCSRPCGGCEAPLPPPVVKPCKPSCGKKCCSQQPCKDNCVQQRPALPPKCGSNCESKQCSGC